MEAIAVRCFLLQCVWPQQNKHLKNFRKKRKRKTGKKRKRKRIAFSVRRWCLSRFREADGVSRLTFTDTIRRTTFADFLFFFKGVKSKYSIGLLSV